MTPRIMPFDMLELCRLPKGRDIPVQLPQPFVQRRITRSDIADVAFEMLNVDGVETNNGGVETNVGFSYVLAEVVWRRVLR